MLSVSTSVLLLKSISLFAETPDHVLADLAAAMETQTVPTGHVICRKGDTSDCLYILTDGQVRVHDGERTLAILGGGDVFGEMAVLDPEPRSASVTAMEPTRLLLLDREAFYQLVGSREEVMRGIIRVIAQRLRARTREMVLDYQYIQQFGRVTAAAAAVEGGAYESHCLDEVATRTDALGQLARVFQRMAHEAALREARLKHQVEEMRIEIDAAKKARQVLEITETDYFQQLQQRAQALRMQAVRY
jgi:CRP-like cAMP-binding protein